MQLNRDELLSAYRTMATARHFEDSVFENFSDGKIPGFVHLSAGQEATAAGVYMSLDERDWIATTHRAHGQCIARGLDLQETMDEIYGASSGVCGGKGGSMHIADLDKGMLGANGIIGATGPLAVGAGLSARAKGENGVAVAFFGDGASNEGAFHGSLNLGSVWKLPVIYVCENNRWASGNSAAATLSVEDVAVRSVSYNIPGVTVDGTDVLAVYEAAQQAIQRARDGGGPTLLECKTYRWRGHSESKGNPPDPRPEGEIQLSQSYDPIAAFAGRLVEQGGRRRVNGSSKSTKK